MICEVCGTYFLDEECLSRLFVFEDICMSCREALKPRLLFEVFPIAYGEVHYYYLYEDLKISYYIKRKLASKLERLYQMIIDEGMKYDLIVFLDDELLSKMTELSMVLLGFQQILMFSLCRQDVVTHLKV